MIQYTLPPINRKKCKICSAKSDKIYAFLRRGSTENVRVLIISLGHSKSPVNYSKVRYRRPQKFLSSIYWHITTAYTVILTEICGKAE